MLRVSNSRFYFVPVLMHSLDILELLSRTVAPLKMNEISDITGVPLTTTYRILQTLVHRGYLAHDLEGKYRMPDLPEMKTAFQSHGGPPSQEKRSVT